MLESPEIRESRREGKERFSPVSGRDAGSLLYFIIIIASFLPNTPILNSPTPTVPRSIMTEAKRARECQVIHSWSAPRSLSTSLMYSFAQVFSVAHFTTIATTTTALFSWFDLCVSVTLLPCYTFCGHPCCHTSLYFWIFNYTHKLESFNFGCPEWIQSTIHCNFICFLCRQSAKLICWM